MYNRVTIENEFMGLVGLRQNQNPDFEALSSSLIYTGQNLLIQHPLLNIENLDMTSRNYGFYNFADYNALTSYSAGQRVRSAGIVYESLVNSNLGNTPATSTTQWEQVNLLSLYLEDVFKNAIDETVQQVFRRKKLSRQTKTLLQNQRLSDGVGGFNDRVVNEGDLVGVQFYLKHRNNIKAVIERIGLQLTGPDTLNMYVYHSSQVEPIATVAITHTATGSLQWHTANVEINFLSDSYDAGGAFFIMYDQNDLGTQAIRKRHNWHIKPCSYCNRRDIDYFNLYTQYLYLHTVRVKAVDRNAVVSTNMWDIEKTEYVPDNNFGLNFEWTVQCDLTRFIVQHKQVFEYALRDMTIVKLLESMINSTRQNGLDEKVRTLARAELQSTHIGGMGLASKLEKQLDEVDFEISALDSTCMPCNKKTGLKIHAAGLSRNG